MSRGSREQERERILQAVAQGELSPEEGDRLLTALSRPRISLWRRLLFPTEHLSTATALGLGAGAAAVGLLLGLFHVRFDGALDTHHTSRPVPFGVGLVDLAVSWPLPALLFWGAARLFARKGRLVDHLAAVGVARIPAVLSGVVIAVLGPLMPPPPTVVPGEAITLELGAWVMPALLIAAGTLPFLVLFITLLVTTFRTASGLRGARLALAFIPTLLLAEVLSKVALLAASRWIF